MPSPALPQRTTRRTRRAPQVVEQRRLQGRLDVRLLGEVAVEPARLPISPTRARIRLQQPPQPLHVLLAADGLRLGRLDRRGLSCRRAGDGRRCCRRLRNRHGFRCRRCGEERQSRCRWLGHRDGCWRDRWHGCHNGRRRDARLCLQSLQGLGRRLEPPIRVRVGGPVEKRRHPRILRALFGVDGSQFRPRSFAGAPS